MTVFLKELEERTRDLERDLLALQDMLGGAEHRDPIPALLRAAHSLKGAAGLVQLKPIEAICHRMEDIFTAIRDGRTPIDDATVQLLIRATDGLAEAGQRLASGGSPDTGALDAIRLDLAATPSGSGPEAPTQSVPVPPVGRKLPSGDDLPAEADAGLPHSSRTESWVRIPARNLDALLRQSGELLIARARARGRVEQVRQLQDQIRSAKRRLARPARADPVQRRPEEGDLRRISRGLQELAADLAGDRKTIDLAANALDAEVRRARLQLFSAACEGLDRLVRDLARASGKQARLDILGGAIEIDRALAEGLDDVLRHLVRNAMDHGIETVAERRAAGKPDQGTISIHAALNGDRLDILFFDDGRGIDVGQVEEAAARSGIPRDGNDPLRHIFLPGLSTSEAVTTVSGRGIGLDIVRTSVEAMRGAIEVSSELGQGASFAITLPLALGTIRALLVQAGDQVLAIDTSSVTRIIRVSSDQMRSTENRRYILTGSSPAPALDLGDWLGLPAGSAGHSPAKYRTAVLLNEIGRGAAIIVDAVLAEQECLVRTVGARLRNLRDYSGGSILPDGNVALVLNAACLGEGALRQSADAGGQDEPGSSPLHRILIAEDSLTVRTLTKTILQGSGYEVITAADGDQAWQMLQKGGADLVLADVDMPGLDGFALTRRIRQSPTFRDLPVILLTARESEDDKHRGLEAGADAYLVKSAFDQRELLRFIGQFI